MDGKSKRGKYKIKQENLIKLKIYLTKNKKNERMGTSTRK